MCLVHDFRLNIAPCKVSGTSALKTVLPTIQYMVKKFLFQFSELLISLVLCFPLVIDMAELGLIACCFLSLTSALN